LLALDLHHTVTEVVALGRGVLASGLGPAGTPLTSLGLPPPLPGVIAAALDRVASGGARERFQVQLTDRSRLLAGEIVPRRTGDRIGGAFALLWDSTAARDSAVERLKFERALELSSDAVFITDLTGAILYVNPAFERVYGFSRDEALGKNPRLIRSGLVPPAVYASFWESLLSKRTVGGVIQNRRKDGQIVVIEGANSPILDEHGEIIGFLAIHRDVGERMRAEESLRFTQEAIDRASQPVSWIDAGGHYVYANDRAAALTGLDRAELVGRPIWEFEAAKAPPAWAELFERLRRERTVALECSLTSVRGETTDLEVSCNYMALGGRELAVCFGRDVSERHRIALALAESESRYRQLVELSPEAIGVHDGKKFLFANSAAGRLLGLAHPDELVGVPILKVVHPDSHRLAASRAFSLAPGQVASAVEEKFLRADGGAVDVEVIAVGVVHGGLPAVMVLARDISERKRNEADQQRIAVQLDQARRMDLLGQLAGGIAHDFNNILSAVLGFSEIVLASLSGESSLKSDIEQIRAAAQRATALTRQLLAFSRRQPVQPREIAPNEVVAQLSKMLGRLIGENIALELRLAPEVPTIFIDPAQLEQVVMNLAVNARDAMPDGGRLVLATDRCRLGPDDLAGEADARPGEFVRITVADNGLGMPDDVMRRLFEPFFTTKPVGKGTGLGLSVVYGVVKQNGGHIQVDSAVGRGTTFRVYLKAGAETAAATEVPSDDARGGRGETILLVEDDPDVRSVTSRVLAHHGYRVIEANCAERALDLLGRMDGSVQLVLTDVVMPGMGGLELGKRLRERGLAVPVLYTSGYFDELRDAQGVLRPGVNLLTKPVETRALLERVRAVLPTDADR
jgi:PAS domain S-box-containing protein